MGEEVKDIGEIFDDLASEPESEDTQEEIVEEAVEADTEDNSEGEEEAHEEADEAENASENSSEDGVDEEEGETQEAVDEQEEEPTAPSNWSEQHKEAFNKLSADGKEFLLDRHKDMEADYTRKTQELAEQRKTVEPLAGTLNKWSGYINSLGMQPENVIDTLITAEQSLRTGTPAQKQQMFAQLAKDYGITLGTSDDMGLSEEEYKDPNVTALQEETSLLKQKLSSIEQANQAAHTQSLQQQVESFRTQQDAEGNLLHPHFDSVREDMSIIVSKDPNVDMETAYNKAVRMNDEIFSKVQAEKQKSSEKQSKAEMKKSVKVAKKAKVVNIKSRSAEAVRDKTNASLKDDISNTWDELRMGN